MIDDSKTLAFLTVGAVHLVTGDTRMRCDLGTGNFTVARCAPPKVAPLSVYEGAQRPSDVWNAAREQGRLLEDPRDAIGHLVWFGGLTSWRLTSVVQDAWSGWQVGAVEAGAFHLVVARDGVMLVDPDAGWTRLLHEGARQPATPLPDEEIRVILKLDDDLTRVEQSSGDLIHVWCEAEGCGREEDLTAEDAYESGWDFASPKGPQPLGVVSPRTCPDHGIEATVWWALINGDVAEEDLTDHQRAVLRRIERDG